MSNVYEKLQQARVDLQAENLKKSGKNKFSGFSYYELSDFIPTVNIIFSKLKLCSNFSIKNNEAQLQIINSELPDEKVIFTMPTAELELKGCTAIQALGGVNTYCRRYLYLNALEIVESDLLDNKAGDLEEKPKTKKELKEQSISESWELPTGIITQEENNTLKNAIGAAKWAKVMTEHKGKIPYEVYYDLLGKETE